MTRLNYTVDSLRAQVEAKHAAAVADAETEYAKELDLPARRAAWRAEQEKRVRRLARNLRNLTDDDLAAFSIKRRPEKRPYGSPESRKAQAIEQADNRRAWALRRIDGLSATDGTVSLTSKMLTDWFGL